MTMVSRFAVSLGLIMVGVASIVALTVVLGVPRGAEIRSLAWIHMESAVALVTLIIGTPAFLLDCVRNRSGNLPVRWEDVSYLLLPLPMALFFIHVVAFLFGRIIVE